MHYFFYILFLFFPLFGMAQKDTVAHLFAIGGTGIDKAEAVEATSDGGYIVVGSNSTNTSGNTDVYLFKTDSLINIEWSWSIGGTNNDWGYAVKQTYDKGYIVAVSSNSFGNGGYDAVLMKRDSLGNYQWTKTYGGANWDFVYDLVITHDSGFVFCGETFNNAAGQSDVFVVRTNKNGDTLWTKTIGGTLIDKGNSIIETSDSNIVVAGLTNTTTDSTQVYVLKFSKTGQLLWDSIYGGSGYDIANAIIETTNSEYVIGGTTTSFNTNNDKDFYLARTTINGTLIWQNFFGNPGEEETFDLFEDANGNLISVGFTKSAGAGEKDAVIFVVSSTAVWLNMGVTYGRNKSEQIKSLTYNNNSFVLVGNTNSFGVGLDDVLLIKLDTIIPGMDTTITIVADNITVGIPTNLQKQQKWTISPNPASNYININTNKIHENSTATISIIDINGVILLNKKINTSKNLIDVSMLKPGFYSILINDNNKFIEAQKLIINTSY